jgi:hypothetical protein
MEFHCHGRASPGWRADRERHLRPDRSAELGRIRWRRDDGLADPATTSEIETTQNLIALAFGASSAAYSTTTTPLASWFCTDLVTLDAGHVVWSGALTPATDICNGAGVTFSFAVNALKATIQ